MLRQPQKYNVPDRLLRCVWNSSQYNWLITSRLDADDVLHPNWIASVQAHSFKMPQTLKLHLFSPAPGLKWYPNPGPDLMLQSPLGQLVWEQTGQQMVRPL